MPFKNPRRGGF
ncbi:hypothetical protein VCHC52A1_2134, partial [Vibrio cholerae HC-52A1]